ncbi:TIGR02679 domain-containing protein [Streptomyces sp. NBC_00523]|nr:TIGR02679 domain-containing protein [Streptomyces sp. NBC_00523]
MSGGTTSREHFASGDTTLRRPELHPVCQTGHDRLPSGSPITRVRLALLDETQREALADLLDLDRLPDPQPPVALARLEEAVTELTGRTVREIVAELIGPLGDRAGERRRQEDERAGLLAWLAGHDTVRAQPVLADWAASCRAAGWVAARRSVPVRSSPTRSRCSPNYRARPNPCPSSPPDS